MTVKLGLVGWDDFEFGKSKKNSGGGGGSGDPWMRLQSGDNLVRLLTKPHVYMQHKYREKGDKGYGEKIPCSKIERGDPCPICALNTTEAPQYPKPRWFIGLIDREDDTYKILDFTPSVYQGIKKLNGMDSWGDPVNYDINIIVDHDGGPSGFYTVLPDARVPLTPSDLEKKQKLDLDVLVRKCVPPSPEKVQERLDRYRANQQGSQNPSAEVSEALTEAPVVAVAASGGTDVYRFTQN